MTVFENDALSLEYKLVNGCATGYIDISDLMDDPGFEGVIRIPGNGFKEEFTDFLFGDLRPLGDDSPNPLLIGLE